MQKVHLTSDPFIHNFYFLLVTFLTHRSPTKDETSETIVRNLYCLFPYIPDTLQIYAILINKPKKDLEIVFTVSSFVG